MGLEVVDVTDVQDLELADDLAKELLVTAQHTQSFAEIPTSACEEAVQSDLLQQFSLG